MPTAPDNLFADLDDIVEERAPLAPLTWYRIGGPARYLVRPRTPAELADVARRCAEHAVPMRVLGLGANLLVADEGVDGAVIRLDADHWRQVRVTGTTIEVGAGADLQKLVLRTVRAGLAGLECLAGIPGTVGGSVRMNAGGKFGDLGSVVSRVSVMDPAGNGFAREKGDLVFGYRSTNIAAPFVLGATLELEEDDPHRILRRTKEIWMYKRNTQPLNTKSCGCVFKNPPGQSAGALIDAAGLKGTRVGGAEVSDKHANFVVAHPGCRSADVLGLIRLIRERVADRSGVELESEVQVWE
jgi:UDP-N-acetylmuramate dehydrogenase